MPITDYLTAVIRPLLKHPDTLTVKEVHDDMGILLTVDVHRDDMGILVGKAGETANAIRHIVRVVGRIANARVSVKINEPKN